MSIIYIATFSEDTVDVAKENNVNIELNDICISENLDPGSFDRTLECMRSEIAGAGAEDVIMHGPFTEIIPAGIDHRFVDMGIVRLNEAYEACRALNINRMVVHSGYEPLMYFKEYDVYRWIEILGDRIGHFHLHNNDGSGDQHRALMDGSLDMERIIKCANRFCGSDVTFTIESHECRESAPWLKNILENK